MYPGIKGKILTLCEVYDRSCFSVHDFGCMPDPLIS